MKRKSLILSSIGALFTLNNSFAQAVEPYNYQSATQRSGVKGRRSSPSRDKKRKNLRKIQSESRRINRGR